MSGESDPELMITWQRHIGSETALLERLLARHREKHRRYHTAAHVGWVIRQVEELSATESIEHLDEVIAAAFYHDAIYEPAYPANERASARLARRDLAVLGWSDDRTERVASMIEATVHSAETPAGDAAILLDADLAILAADPAGYSAYVTGVRKEYRDLDDDEWRTGRAQVLQGFLDRSAIYATTSARERWEDRARANLTAELSSLA